MKMCTVSVLLEAHRNWESVLKTRELMVTYLENSEGRTREPEEMSSKISFTRRL